MSKKIRFKQTVKKIIEPYLQPLGYELIDYPEAVGIGLFFFRKHLFEDIYALVGFDLSAMALPPLPRRFDVLLSRNRGDKLKYGYGEDEHPYENWLLMPLAQLIWVVLGLKVYSSQYHWWEFVDQEGLELQLQDTAQKLVQYGIPWLEDPESKNPYPS